MFGLSRKQLAFATIFMVLAFGAGTFAGWYVTAVRAQFRDKLRVDISRGLRAVDLNNRISMLRLLRERKLPEEQIRSIEISALLVLDSLEVAHVSPADQSCFVLKDSANRLAEYLKDFPQSEFDPRKDQNVATLLSQRAKNDCLRWNK